MKDVTQNMGGAGTCWLSLNRMVTSINFAVAAVPFDPQDTIGLSVRMIPAGCLRMKIGETPLVEILGAT